MAKPLEIWTRWGTLATVFSPRTNRELHALIASLCVLFEDMRIELSGQAEADLGALDECNKEGRKLYFLRRSVATLYEFSTMIQELDRLPSFQSIKATFEPAHQKTWATAVRYFKKYNKYVTRLRHNIGGHFGRQAATLAIENLLPDAGGFLEVIFYEKGAGAKFCFANEIAATGVLQHVPGDNIAAKSRILVRHAVVGYRKAARAVDCITRCYLWDRFGKG